MEANSFLVVALFLLITICGESVEDTSNCESNVCYKDVRRSNNDLLKLILRYDKTQPTAPELQELSKIKSLLEELEIIDIETEKNFQALNTTVTPLIHESLKNYKIAKKIRDDAISKLKNITNISDDLTNLQNILNILQKNSTQLETHFAKYMKAKEACESAIIHYNELKELVKYASDEINAIRKFEDQMRTRAAENNKNISKIYNDSVLNEKYLNSLHIPEKAVQSFIIAAEDKIDQLLLQLNKNKYSIEGIFKSLLNRELNSLQGTINELRKIVLQIQSDLKVIFSSINEYDKMFEDLKFSPTVDDNILNILKDLITSLEELRLKITSYRDTFDEIKTSFLKNRQEMILITKEAIVNIREETKKLTEYNLILSTLLNFSEKEKMKIREELDKLIKTILLISKKRMLETEFQEVKNIYDELLRTENRCADSIEFEN